MAIKRISAALLLSCCCLLGSGCACAKHRRVEREIAFPSDLAMKLSDGMERAEVERILGPLCKRDFSLCTSGISTTIYDVGGKGLVSLKYWMRSMEEISADDILIEAPRAEKSKSNMDGP
jgi:hypothetical protein